MTRRVLVIDLASPLPTKLMLSPRVLIPMGPDRATVATDGATVEQVIAELLAAGLSIRRCRVVEEG